MNAWILKLDAENYRRREDREAVPHYTPPKRDPVIEANCALLRARSAVGIKKYGGTLDEKRYSERELIVHALQEALDLSNYLQAQLQRVDREADNVTN